MEFLKAWDRDTCSDSDRISGVAFHDIYHAEQIRLFRRFRTV